MLKNAPGDVVGPAEADAHPSEPRSAEVVAARIRKSIIRGELKAGDLLPAEPRLIERYGVARSTIREAIRILESEHMVMVQRGATGGARILRPGWNLVSRAAGIALQTQGATLKDVYDARALIEPAAARRAAEERPKEAAQALHVQVELEYLALGDWRQSSVAGMDFHRILLEESRSPTLLLIGASLKNIVDQHQALKSRRGRAEDTTARLKRVRAALRSHEKLADLIGAGKALEAERHWRRHMASVRDTWLVGAGDTAVIDLLD